VRNFCTRKLLKKIASSKEVEKHLYQCRQYHEILQILHTILVIHSGAKHIQTEIKLKSIWRRAIYYYLLGNKQEELEATMLLESYNLIALTETWWDESHDWRVAIDGYRLFRRDSWERGVEVLPSTSRNHYSVKLCP